MPAARRRIYVRESRAGDRRHHAVDRACGRRHGAATNVVVVNGTTITAVTPAHAAGTVDVAVTNNDATTAALAGGFTYSSCTTAAPMSDWVCVNGGWVPPGHPSATGGSSSGGTTGGSSSGGATGGSSSGGAPGGGSSCTTTAPASNWICVNGGWVPPGHPLAIQGLWRRQLRTDLTERLDALPGVESAAAGTSLLLSRLPNSASINIEGRPPLAADAKNIPVPYDSVTPEFFSTLQIPLRSGRMFTGADGPTSQPVVMVNEAFVRRFFPGEDPLGRRVTFGDPSRPGTRWQTIIGVIADTKRAGFEREPWAETYFPMRQSPESRAFVLLRTDGDPAALIAAARAAVWSIDRNQAIAAVRTVPELLAQRELNRRFTTLLLGVFASVALALAIIGTYGVIAHGTAQRTQEIGIRLALGADSRMILRMVLAGGLRIAAAGLTLGVVGALALTNVLSGLLFGVSARDPFTFVVAPGALLIVALAACWIPARRAMRVEPVVALRGDS